MPASEFVLRPKKEKDTLIPLINIVFLLLIFFMVAGQMKTPISNDVNLPETSLEPRSEQAETIELHISGDFSFHGQTLSLEALQHQIAALPAEAIIAIRADHSTTAKTLDPLLELLRNNQRTNVRLITKPQAS